MDAASVEAASPVLSYQRHHSLDLARGIAVLMILVVNIWAFAMPFAAYMNPPLHGDFSGVNQWVWLLSFIIVQEKFITIFSILFGAGVALFVEHAKAKNQTVGRLHYKRMFILFIIGMVHAYLFWSGDILVAYAVLGMLAYWFVEVKNKTLIIWMIVFFAISLLMVSMSALSFPYMTEADKLEYMKIMAPESSVLQAEIEAMRGGFIDQIPTRAKNTFELQTIFLAFYGVRLLAHMLLGIFLYRIGFLTAQKSSRFYLSLAFICFAIGLPLATMGGLSLIENEFSLESFMSFNQLNNNVGSLIMALGYLSLICLWSKTQWASALRSLLQEAGKMAFTVYLGSTLLCTTLFNGHGFGLFGHLDRLQQFFVVLVVWIILMSFAHWWLKKHRQGPMEALWRRATYGKA